MYMQEKEKISQRQLTVLVMMFFIGSSILISPSGLAFEAKQDAWLAAILSVCIGLLIVYLYVSLSNRFTLMTLAQYSELVLGKWMGKLVSLLYSIYFFILSSLVLRNLGDFLTIYDLPHTPIETIHILFLLLVVMAVRLRVETFARTAEIFFPFVILIALFVVILIMPQIHLTNMQPVFEGGIKPIIRGSIPLLGTPIFELVVFLLILPAVNRKKGEKTGFLKGYLLGGSIIIIYSMLTILVLGVDISTRKIFPTYVLAKQINVGDFFQRLEAIVSILWFITIFIKITICFYASAICMAQSLKINDYRILILPLSMIMIVLSLVAYPNTTYFLTVIGSTWPYIASVFGLFLPLLLLIISFLTKKTKHQ